jgi:CHAD domain-containing protein
MLKMKINLNFKLNITNYHVDGQGDVTVCKYCYELLEKKKKRINFSKALHSTETQTFLKQYETLAAQRIQLDKQFAEYLEKAQTLDTSILDHFKLVSKDDATDTDEEEVSFSDPVRRAVSHKCLNVQS